MAKPPCTVDDVPLLDFGGETVEVDVDTGGFTVVVLGGSVAGGTSGGSSSKFSSAHRPIPSECLSNHAMCSLIRPNDFSNDVFTDSGTVLLSFKYLSCKHNHKHVTKRNSAATKANNLFDFKSICKKGRTFCAHWARHSHVQSEKLKSAY